MAGWAEFKKVAERFGIVGGLAVGGSAIAPIVAKAIGFAPLWPGDVQYLTSLFILVTIMFVFFVTRAVTRRTYLLIIGLGSVLFIVSVLVYLMMLGRFIYTVPSTGERVELGCTWRNDFRDLKQPVGRVSECPGDFAEDLEGAGNIPARIWTDNSVQNVRLVIFLMWLLTFVSLASVICTFVISLTRPARVKRHRRRSNRSDSRAG